MECKEIEVNILLDSMVKWCMHNEGTPPSATNDSSISLLDRLKESPLHILLCKTESNIPKYEFPNLQQSKS